MNKLEQLENKLKTTKGEEYWIIYHQYLEELLKNNK